MNPKHERPLRFERRRELALSAREAWRVLGDTDHMNRVLRAPAVEFSGPGGPEAGFVRTARARVAGRFAIAYREHPFEWVRDRGYDVLRELEGGPIRSARIGVALDPILFGDAGGAGAAGARSDAGNLASPPPAAASGDRVRVTTYVELVPVNLAGRLAASVAGPRMVAAMLDYCADALERRASGAVDPLPRPRAAPQVDRERLDALAGRLAAASVPSHLVAALRDRVAGGTDAQVLRVRPYEVADDWGADRGDVLRLFLHATRAGLFELRWELMCPACRVPKSEVESLATLPQRFHCDTCGIDYESNFDERVELRFSVHPAVRSARDEVYCVGGPLRTPFALAQQVLAPGESRILRAPAEGRVELRSPGAMGVVELTPAREAPTPPRPAAGSRRPARASDGFGPEEPGDPSASSNAPAPEPLELVYGDAGWSVAGEPVFAAGEVRLRLVNRTGRTVLARLETKEWNETAVTAARVTALQEFRDLFSSEVLAPGQEVGVRSVALLFSDLRGSTSLYQGVGDAPAYGRVNRHFEFLRERIAVRGGAVVKTIGDAIMGAFSAPEDALRAALAIQRELAPWCAAQGIAPPFVLRVGIHAGPAIAVNANGLLDYFGRTVNLAARIERESRGGDVVLARALADDPRVRRALAEAEEDGFGLEGFSATLRGVEGHVELIRLTPEPELA